MTNEVSNQILDRALEAELRNPRVLGWSVIIKDNQPVYNNNILKNKIIGASKPTIISDKNENSFILYSNLSSSSSSSKLNNKENNNNFLGTIFNHSESYSHNNNDVIKRDFSIWRCLYWPEIAINPLYSRGYGKMRLALCLNKIITSIIEKNFPNINNNENKNDYIELLPFIRIFYDDELLFQSCIVIKNICIILEIDVHHPLSNIMVEVFDFDDSDPSLVGNSDDCLGRIIVPISVHSNRKPLESRLVIGTDEETRLLFIRKSHQKKVLKDNLNAHKLLRFPIKSCDKDKISGNNKSIDKYYEFFDEELQIIDNKILNRDNEEYMDELPNIIYYEIANQMVKDAIELSRSAEKKYKTTGRLQNPYCNFVIQIYSEIKWTRFSIIPREIFALYLPEPNNKSKSNNSIDNMSIDINIKIIINSMITLRELYCSDCFNKYKEIIFRLYNWNSYLLSLFTLSVIWYILFHPKYLYSMIFFIVLYLLFNNFNKKNQFKILKNSISSKLKTSEILDFNTDTSEEKKTASPILINQEVYNINNNIENFNENNKNSNNENNNDFTILQTLLTSSALSPNSINYIKKFSIILEKLTKYIFNLMKLIYWYNFLESFIFSLLSTILLIISLIYPKEFCKYMQYLFLLTFLLSSTYFLPPIKRLFRIMSSYKKYKRIKRKSY